MSGLPPYSTYRTDNKQMLYPQQLSHGNVLTFTPPGFNQTLNVKFPDCRLAVCEKCKKNYKTRDMCRVRNAHTSEPWTTAYICITLDDNCTDSRGKYIDRPLAVRMVQWQPFCAKIPFDPKTPVCSACKKTNRTRNFCRERHKHRQLPWCTVYVLLSPADSIDPSTRVAPESTPAPDGKRSGSDKGGEKGEDEENNPDSVDAESEFVKEKQPRPATGEEADEGDDINDIAESRTFLAKVSCRHASIHWVEMAEFDVSTQDAAAIQAVDMSRFMPAVDQAQYYAQSTYAAHQHQYNLKQHQQYFFQLQQRQHQQYAAQQAAWQAQYNQHHAMPSPGGVQQSVASPTPETAGEAAAQQSKNYEPNAAAHQQWAYHQQMYQNQMAQFQQAGGIIPSANPPPVAPEQSVDYSQQAQGETDDMEPAPVHGNGNDGENEGSNKRARYE